jgi:F-type H+-transporting ATPase subunit delta
MNQSKIPVRYAKALFLLGKEKGMLAGIAEEVSMVERFINGTPSLIPWMKSPAVKQSEKKSLFRRQFNSQVSPAVMKFIELIIDKQRERFLPDILRNFLLFQKAEAGIKTVILTTAIDPDEEIKQKVMLHFNKHFNKGFELVSKVKKSIVGGFTIQVDDLFYDASMLTQIKRLKTELTGQIVAGIGEKDIETK